MRVIKDYWNPEDEAQIKGLLLWKKDGPIWNSAPKEMREKALALEASGWKPVDHTMPDIEAEERLAIQEDSYDLMGRVR